MLRPILAMLLLGSCPLAGAQVSTYADVRAGKGVQLSAQELRELLPGAKVISRTREGSTRHWQNKADGTFSATSDGRGVSGGRNAYASAEGTWQVTDNGRWCVKIPWPRAPDDWCRYMFKLGDKYYGVGTLSEEAPASEFEFSK